jgi:hypothetical protein
MNFMSFEQERVTRYLPDYAETVEEIDVLIDEHILPQECAEDIEEIVDKLDDLCEKLEKEIDYIYNKIPPELFRMQSREYDAELEIMGEIKKIPSLINFIQRYKEEEAERIDKEYREEMKEIWTYR